MRMLVSAAIYRMQVRLKSVRYSDISAATYRMHIWLKLVSQSKIKAFKLYLNGGIERIVHAEHVS